MAVVDVLRPNVTVSLSSPEFSFSGAATAHAAVSDNLDTSYISQGVMFDVPYAYFTMPSHTPPANHQRHRFLIRARCKEGTYHTVWLSLTGSTADSALTCNHSAYLNNTAIHQVSSPYVLFRPGDASAAQVFKSNFGSLANTGLVVYELYMDIDNRHKPTFDADVKKLDGTSAAGGVVDDTFRPGSPSPLPTMTG